MDSILTRLLEQKEAFPVRVKAHAKKNEVTFDEEKGLFIIEVKEEAQDNKANIELIKFLSRLLKRKVEIVKGFTSKNKLIRIL
jgi:uncharacterized protein